MISTRTKIIVVLITVSAILSGVIVFQLHKIKTLRNERDQAVKFSNSKDDTVETYVNKYGQAVARNEMLELTTRNAQKLLEDERLSFVKGFEGVNKRLNNLEQATKTVAEINKTLTLPFNNTPIVIRGEDGVKTFTFRDSLNSVSGWLMKDSVVLKLHAVVPIYSAVYWQRNKFLGVVRMWPAKKVWYNELMSTNPNVTIKSQSNMRIGKLSR